MTKENKIIYQKFIKREDVRRNRKQIYIFGDNDVRSGFGGQAKEMRGEPNSIGIRVKKLPNNAINSFYSDDDYLENIEKILDDFIIVEKKLLEGAKIVIPEGGIGTGLSRLKEYAPMTFNFLVDCISYLEMKYNKGEE